MSEGATMSGASEVYTGMTSLQKELMPTSFSDIIASPGNAFCADCRAPQPDWCSLAFGALVCLECSGFHRSLGVHITLVRSLKLDGWSEQQLKYLTNGGNKAFTDFCQESVGKQMPTALKLKYSNPNVLYYREVLLAKVEQRQAKPFNAADYAALVAEMTTPKSSMSDKPVSSPDWTPDNDAAECMICVRPFTMVNRRHHCRRCGKCVCGKCAPTENTRPIPEWDLKEPVRHCKLCYMSPSLSWT